MKVAVGTKFPKEGDFCWDDETNPKRITIGIPSIGTIGLPVLKGDDPGTSGAWGWDGNLDHPTLTPSINSEGGSGVWQKWHGYLRGGKLECA